MKTTATGIKLQARSGALIKDVAKEACYVAATLRIDVAFQFNGVTAWVQVGDEPEAVVERYFKLVDERQSYLKNK